MTTPQWWQCRCGYLVNDVCYQDAITDLQCPRCYRLFSTFHKRSAAPWEGGGE